ncbi:MAG: hypothetical protein HY717_13405 [Planctomycetes bacterium]|nr:hypothetical protein [Planctomycetota bacterium]
MIAGALPPLPGPALDLAVDLNGDGISDFGDKYAFNYWLLLGGDLGTALSAAEVGKNGTIDLSRFFRSSEALLAPRVVEAEPLQESAAAGSGTASTCPTSASILPPFGEPSTPASVFANCQVEFRYPTGAEMDSLQGLWCARGLFRDPASLENGIAFLNLSQVPPMDKDGSIPVSPTLITEASGFVAEDLAVRSIPAGFTHTCGANPQDLHAMSTWPGRTAGGAICRTERSTTGICNQPCVEINASSDHGGEPVLKNPWGIDVVRNGMPAWIGSPEDVIFSDIDEQGVKVRRGIIITACKGGVGNVVTTLHLFGPPVVKIWGLALGDFKGTGVFGAYYVAQVTSGSGPRTVRRLIQSGSQLLDQHFATLTWLGANQARSIAFDPISGDLFVSEDQAVNLSGTQARIWRINASGTVRLFGKNFNKPNGIAFHPSGVLLVAEEAAQTGTGNVLAAGGWRNLFKRGDANGDGAVDISDPIVIWNWVNQSGPAPECLDGADANDDSKVLGDDGDLIANFLFIGGPAPPAPGPFTAGRDPTAPSSASAGSRRPARSSTPRPSISMSSRAPPKSARPGSSPVRSAAVRGIPSSSSATSRATPPSVWRSGGSSARSRSAAASGDPRLAPDARGRCRLERRVRCFRPDLGPGLPLPGQSGASLPPGGRLRRRRPAHDHRSDPHARRAISRRLAARRKRWRAGRLPVRS